MDWDPQARARLGELMAVTPAQTVAVLNHLGVADLLAGGPVDVEELAERVGAHAMTLYRLLRFAASYGVFAEVEPRRFGLTPMASFLRSDAPDSAFWWVADGAAIKPWWPWEEWMETVRTGEPAYDRVHGRSYWEGLAADPEARAMFDLSCRGLAEHRIPALLPLLDLGGRHRAVEVGAGEASWLVAVLGAHPELTGVALDKAEALPAATARLANAGLADRAEVVVGDFFATVPPGDVILLANVLHDWDDERAGVILGNCRRALEPGGLLVIIDRVLPADDSRHHGKAVDINMLFNLGGRERTLREFQALLAGAGLSLTRHESGDAALGVLWAEAGPVAVPSSTSDARRDPTIEAPGAQLPSTTKPLMAIVSGPSGSGKTTLAHELAREVGCPAICRDEIKEGMVATLGGHFQPTPGDPLTRRTFGVFFEVLALLLRAGVTIVAEAAFQDRLWGSQLESLAEIADLRIIDCQVDPELARQRVIDRASRTAHADASVTGDLGYFTDFERLSWPAPTLRVDTSNGYAPALDEIVRFVADGRR